MRVILFFFSFCWFVVASAQPSVQLRVAPLVTTTQGTVKATYTIAYQRNLPNINFPEFKGWRVIEGPIQASTKRINDGGTTYVNTYTYTLQPQQVGSITVPGLGVEIQGKYLEALAAVVVVKDTATTNNLLPSLLGVDAAAWKKLPQQKKGQSLDAYINENCFATVEVSSNKVFQYQPILVTYKLYRAIKAQSKVVAFPQFDGFTVIENTTDEPATTETKNNRLYRVDIIRKVQLIPLEAKTYTLDNATVENNIELNNNGSLQQVQLLTHTNKPTIEVQHLPQGMPTNTPPIVGTFKVTSNLPDTVEKGKAFEWILTVKGNGYLPTYDIAPVTWPKGVKYYETTYDDTIQQLQFPQYIERTYRITLAASDTGTLSLPTLQWVYFNTTTKRVDTLQMNDAFTKVIPATAVMNTVAAAMYKPVGNTDLLFVLAGIIVIVVLILWVYFKKNNTHTDKQLADASAQLQQVTSWNAAAALYQLYDVGAGEPFLLAAIAWLKQYQQHYPLQHTQEVSNWLVQLQTALYAPQLTNAIDEDSVRKVLQGFLKMH
ncbi:MAG: BatD family protein [Chitinophagaceae bacterium]